MARAFVVMTALPPTIGHRALIEFARWLNVTSVEVILCTQPDEPWTQERYDALQDATHSMGNVRVHRIHRTLPQEPEEGDATFWPMWAQFLTDHGITKDDYVVSSEAYGVRLAEITGAKFMPYDPNRDVVPAKATKVREATLENWNMILPEFQQYLQQTVTIFGAESTGKTTLARMLAGTGQAHMLPEWARPYLEMLGPETTEARMYDIWEGQRALQTAAQYTLPLPPFIVQDTDLFSTVGFWDYMMDSDTPEGLVKDAIDLQSNLYIVLRSEIPFEVDPLRYGGDKRETDDQYWIDLLERFDLPYVVLDLQDVSGRRIEAWSHMQDLFERHANLDYLRKGREYERVEA